MHCFGVALPILLGGSDLLIHLEGCSVNSEGFLAEVFHPWVRWEGPGSGFENSSGGAGGGVWKSRIGPPWDLGRKTRFSNGLADKRSKVSVKKSQIGFVVINFSRSIFPYMWNKSMDRKKWEFGSGQNWIYSKTRFSCMFFWKMGPGHFSKISIFQNIVFQPFKKCSY